jgi:hypothetical protein
MSAALKFLLAARRCEIRGLEQLALTCELVGIIAELVHALQRERGLSSLFVASRGGRCADARAAQIAACVTAEAAARRAFERLDADAMRGAGGARLFSRIAYVLYGLDGLAALRARIEALQLTADAAAERYTHLIGGLLAVVFEAADTAADPRISRALVALFNFMQGKEFAGQERAAGAAGFALGRFDRTQQHRLQYLIEAQQRCLDVFAEFAEADVAAAWGEAVAAADLAEFERLRRLAAAGGDGSLPVDGASRWFELASRRIDAMKALEDRLSDALRTLCEARLASARAELDDQARLLDALSALTPQTPAAAALLAADGLGSPLGRSILDLVQAQSRRLQQIGDELEAARSALHARKVIERAKGLLMAHRGLTEEQAYRLLRETAMNQSRRLVEVAETVLSLSEFLKQDRGA